MPKQWNINELVLLDTQRQVRNRLRKGEFIVVGQGVLEQAKEILNRNQVPFVTVPYSFGTTLITIN